MHANVRRINQAVEGYPWWGDPQIFPTHAKHASVRQVRAYLDANYAEPISLSQLGDLIHVSPFCLLRLFRAEVGLSPLHYQTQLRVASARQLLQSGLPVAQVAAETGFVDQPHLTHHFKRCLGLTPGQYRRLSEISSGLSGSMPMRRMTCLP